MAITKGVNTGIGRHALIPDTWNGFGSPPYGWSDSAPPANYHAAIGAIFADYWFHGKETIWTNVWGTSDQLRTQFKHRQPMDFDPNFLASDPTGALMTPAREQQIADNILDKLNAAGFTFMAHDWYPPLALQLGQTYEVDIEKTLRFWQACRNSTHQGSVRWCWILQDSWLESGAALDSRLAWIAASVDSNYMHVGASRPLVFGFFTGGGATPWSASLIAMVRAAFRAAGKGNPYFVGQGTTNANWISWGADGRTGYGPLDCVPAGGAGAHVAWSAVDAKVQSQTWFINANLNAVPHIMPHSDPRVVGYPQPWADSATSSQWITHLKALETWINGHKTNSPMNISLCYNATELSEAGGLLPTAQTDVHGSGLGLYLDGIAHVNGKVPLASVWNSYTPQNLIPGVITIAGTGWAFATGVDGAYWSSTTSSATTADSMTFVVTTILNGKMRVYGKKGPAQGIMNVTVDGGAATPVDCYAAADAQHQLLFESAALTAAAHTIVCMVTGTKNASSSGFTITHDEFRSQEAAP